MIHYKAETKPLRTYRIFSGFHFRRVDRQRVQVWNTTQCTECSDPVPLTLHELMLFEPSDTPLLLSGVIQDEGTPPPRAYCPFPGRMFCEAHYALWLENKLLPSEQGVGEAYDRT